MPETGDIQLLHEFAERKSDAAFAALVARYVNLVYSVGLRQTGNSHAAEEITQAVFIILARRTGSLGPKTVLSGWLYQTAWLTAANYRRTELRRARREQEAYIQSVLNQTEPDVWAQIAPLLDDAMGKLSEKDRHAILLRFFEDKSLAEVGAILGASEDAAKMRVNRVLEKIRKFFMKRSVTLTTALIASAVSANSVQAAPVELTISAIAAAKGATATASTLSLAKGALKLMVWTKAKTVIVVGVGLALATVITRVVLSHDERGDTNYDTAGVRAFQQQLTNVVPVKRLRFTEIVAGDKGGARHFLAAVDGDNFFLREYRLDEDPNALISTSSWLRGNSFRGRYIVRFRDRCWDINGPFITESSVSDPVVNVCQLEARTARATIDSVLNLGVSAWTVKRGSFAWNNTNSTRFTVGLASNVSFTRRDGLVRTNVGGYIVAKAGLVTRLETLGAHVVYEYATNSLVPFGIPSKITVGRRWLGLFGSQRTFRIKELVYGHTDNPQITFSPESKYDSPDIPRIVMIKKGQRIITQEGHKLLPPTLQR
jgi:RNA polymerase sigma factor (sigma-70 family)